MADIFDRLISQAPSQNPGASLDANPRQPGEDIFDQIIHKQQEDSDKLLMATLGTVSKENPDQVGEAQRLGQQENVPNDIAKRNLDELRQRAYERKIKQQNLAKYSPVLARQLADPDFAAIAFDDTINLSASENMINFFKSIPSDAATGWEQGKLETEYGMLGNRVMLGTATDEEIQRVADINKKMRAGATGGTTLTKATAKILGQMSETMPEAAEYGAYTGMTAGTAAGIAGQIGPQVLAPEELITVPAATIGGFFAGSMTKMSQQSFAIESGAAYLDMIESGIDENVARNVGIGVGVVNAALEVTGVGFVASPIKKALAKMVTKEVVKSLEKPMIGKAVGNFALNYATAWGGEVTTEVLQEVSNIIGEEIAMKFTKEEMQSKLTTEEGRQEIADRLSGIFEEVGKGMALLSLPGASFHFYGDVKKSNKAKRTQTFFEDISKAADESKVRKRNPKSYESFMEAQTNGTPAETIYIHGQELENVLNQVGVTREQLAQQLPDVAAQIDEAVATGGDVTIPTARYASTLAGTDLGNAMQQHMRLDPNAFSHAEAIEFDKNKTEMMNLAKQLMTEKEEADQEFVQQANSVKRQIFDQIKAAKVYPDKIAKAYSEFVRDFVVTNAAELNMMPQEFYDRYMYKVRSSQQVSPETLSTEFDVNLPAQRQVKDQQKAEDLISEISDFSEIDENGLVTVYHRTSEENAKRIRETGKMIPKEDGIFFSTKETGQAEGFGDAVVKFQIPADMLELDDIFDDEAHLRVPARAGRENIVPGDILKQAAQIEGRAVPETVNDASNIESVFDFASGQTFKTNRDFKVAIQDRVNAAAKDAKVDLTDFTKAVEAYLVSVGIQDALTALETNPNAIGWYNDKVTKALRLVSLIHPEIATDQEAKFAFTWALAVTSNGLKVDKNFELAEKAYSYYKENGVMPTNIQGGTAQIAINESLGLFNELVARDGIQAVIDFMTTKQTVKEVKQYTGKNVSGENLTTQVYGAAALGPKIGNGFFANLYGHFEQLTVDRWFMRTWGRWTGTLVEVNKKNIKLKRDQLKSVIRLMSAADKKAFEKIIGAKLVVGKIDEVAKAINKASVKPANRKEMALIGKAKDEESQAKLSEVFGAAKKGQKRISFGDELRKVGNSLTGYLDGQKEAPSGPPERARIRKVMGQVLTKLQQSYNDLTMSDLQALLWYPEKRLYDSAKTADEGVTGYEDDDAPDYANAAAALAKAKGISDEEISRTITEVDNELSLRAAERTAAAERGAGDGLLRQAARGEDGKVIFEVAPDPNDIELSERWNELSGDQRLALSEQVASQIVPEVLAIANAKGEVTTQIGSYLDDTNPSFAIRLTDGDPMEVSKALGFVLSQDSMMAIAATPFEGSFEAGAIKIVVGEKTESEINDIYQALRKIEGHPQIQGQTTTNGEMTILLDEGMDAKALAAAMDETLDGEYEIVVHAINAAFPEKEEYDYASKDSDPAGNEGLARSRYRDARAKAGEVLSEGIEAARRSVAGDLAERSRVESQRRAGGIAGSPEYRGGFDPRKLTTVLNEKADLSTFLHETAHFFLTVYADMATMPGAPARVMEDMQTVLDWFGVADIETWNNMSLDEQRKYHEQFAYNFEIYLAEGTAPSVKMQGLFNKFASWLRRVYRSIQEELNVLYKQETGEDLPMLTGEVKQVMDRMISSEDQITEAEKVRGMAPLFASQEQSGMDDATWAAYQELLKEAHDQAVTDLTKASMRQMKWLSNARSRILKEMQKKTADARKEVRNQVAEIVKALPVYRAMEFLKRGHLDGVPVDYPTKLSIPEIDAMYAGNPILETIKKSLGFGKYGMAGTENGIHPDQAAEMFGFDSGDALIRALLDAKPMKEEIDARTDQRMLDEYSDMSDPVSIEQEVEKALHNEARARFVAAELRFLSKSTAPVRIMTAAAKQVAKQIISGKVIREIRPRDYSSAEARAVKAAEKASKEGRASDAMKEKQNQLIQNQLASEAVSARDEVSDALKQFKKLFKADKRLAKTRNMDLVNAARSILAYYGLGQKDKAPTEYIEKLKAYNPEMYADIEPIIIDAVTGNKDYKDLTLDEFRAMRDVVDALWFQSKRDNEIKINGELVDLQTAVDELTGRLEEIGVPDVLPGEREAVSEKDFKVRSINGLKAMLRRVEHWADATDGPGAKAGPFTRYIWRPIREATDQYRAERNKYVKRYSEMVASIKLPVAKINAPELGYVFGNGNGGLGKAELLGAILHTGNESNLRKLLAGRGWGQIKEDKSLDTSRWQAFIQRMYDEKIITKEDMDWVQSVWDLTEELKPIAQKAHHELMGYYFNEVEASPVETPFGTYRGGYIPAKTDTFMVQRARINEMMEELQQDFRQSIPSTGSGFTKGRVEYNQPLSLDVRLISKHIDDVIRFSYIQPAIKDVLKILGKQQFSNSLTRIDPTAIEGMLKPWLTRAASQTTSTHGMHKGIDRFWNGVRNRTGIAYMFANLVNALQQFTGHFVAMLKVDATYLKNAQFEYLKNPHKVADEVAELSPFMKDRMHSQIFDIQETLNDLLLNPSKYKKVQKWTQRHGYFIQSAFQNQVDVVIWIGAYNQALAEQGADVNNQRAQKEAIARADAAVRLTQDSLAAEDIAAYQAGSPFYKIFVQFTGYFNMLANVNSDEYIKIMRDLGWRGNKGKLVMTYVLGFMMPMLISDAIVRTLGGQWDDEDDDGYLDEAAEWFFGSQIRGAIAMIPAAGPGIAVIGNAFNNKPYDDRITTSPSISALESGVVGTAKAIINVVDKDKEVTGKNVRDTLTLLSLVTGIPVMVLARPVSYAMDVERGRIKPTSHADYIRGLITGKASEESRK